jgi:hypothetical protein
MHMPSSEPPSAATPWYRQFWPWLLISIPAATVVAGIATIWIAAREPVALVHDDYYKEGLAINQDLARERMAAQLNMRAMLRIDAHSAQLSGQLSGDTDTNVLTVMFIHPVASQYDQTVEVLVDDEGRFSLPLPVAGQRWYLELRGDEASLWHLQGEIDLRHSGSTELSARAAQRNDQPPIAPSSISDR